MPENGANWKITNFDGQIYTEAEYHFGVDVEVLYDKDGNASIGWARPGSRVSEMWRREAGIWEDE